MWSIQTQETRTFKATYNNIYVVAGLTEDFAQKQCLDQVEVGVWGIWEGVADWGVMIQLKDKQSEPSQQLCCVLR